VVIRYGMHCKVGTLRYLCHADHAEGYLVICMSVGRLGDPTRKECARARLERSPWPANPVSDKDDCFKVDSDDKGRCRSKNTLAVMPSLSPATYEYFIYSQRRAIA